MALFWNAHCLGRHCFSYTKKFNHLFTGRVFLSGTAFASLNPEEISGKNPHQVLNLVGGEWKKPGSVHEIPDPMTGEPFLFLPDTQSGDLPEFLISLERCPKSGLHNPMKNLDRYLMYGSICAKASAQLRDKETLDFFTKLIQRVAPKSTFQAEAEVAVTRKFLENFSGDQVRFLARSFAVPGDHDGQQSQGYRWPYGPVAIVAPFNFPIEIPMLQLMGALFMGNKPVLKVDSRVSVVMEQALRLLIECGMPPEDVDMIHCDGPVMHELLLRANPRMTQFTGSQRVAEQLAKDLNGRIRIEDAGFDWKILGPDVQQEEYVAWVCDQDAYAFSGQKCSAQSILFVHENWAQSGLLERLEDLAARRTLNDFTIGPVLTVTNQTMEDHLERLLAVPGASLLWGGTRLQSARAADIPPCYGSFQPTAVKLPLQALADPTVFAVATREIFGPFQIIVDYKDSELDDVLGVFEGLDAHLTAAVVSNDVGFQRKVLANSVNGTTYCGIRGRTTGAPQNHWFGPAGDPRAAGIGTPEAIKTVWSCHREIIFDEDAPPTGWTIPKAT